MIIIDNLPPKRQKYSYLDSIRVYAIIMVIVLHCICEYFNNTANCQKPLWFLLGYANELCRTGVPLFFMISGFLLLSKDTGDIKSFYKKRFLKIAIPFIIYDIFYYIYLNLSLGNTLSFIGFFHDLTIQGSAYHLWFVYSILFIYLLIPFLRMIAVGCDKKLLLLFLVLVTFQTTIRPFINTVFNGKIQLFLTDDGFSGYLGYVVLGYILGTYNFSRRTNAIIYTLSIISFIATPLLTMKTASNGGAYLFTGGYSLNHHIEAAGIFLLFKNHINTESKVVSSLSSVSFSAYLIHVFFLEELKQIPFDLSPSSLIVVAVILSLVLSFAWGFAENRIKSKIKYHINNREGLK